MGTPSKVCTVLRGAPAWLHRRTPFGCRAQGTGVGVFSNTLVIAASAGAATDSARHADAIAMPSLTTVRSVQRNAPLRDEKALTGEKDVARSRAREAVGAAVVELCVPELPHRPHALANGSGDLRF